MARTTKKTEQAKPDNNAQANLPAVKRPRGKPRKFQSEDGFQQAFVDYIEHCVTQKLQPNVAGFCVFCDMTKDTFYSQREYYPDCYQKVRSALEDTLVNFHHFTGMSNPAMAIVQGKNTFGWDDRPGAGKDSLVLDAEIDVDEETLDLIMSKLGYLPSPD